MQLEENSTVFTACDDIGKLITPIKNLGFSYFDYVRVYKKDLKRIHLGNDFYWLKIFFEKLYLYENLFFEHIFSEEQSYCVSHINLWGSYFDKKILDFSVIKLEIHQGISIVFKNKHYNEYFYMAANHEDDIVIINFLKKFKEFLRFCFLFKDSASKLIAHAEKNKISAPPNSKRIDLNPLLKIECNLNGVDEYIKKYYINDLCFSKREVEIIYWIAHGKTIDEIGSILKISGRTVETHVEHTKRKLNCNKMTTIVYIFSKCGLI